MRIYEGLTNEYSEITAFILDSLKKRMIIGDSSGYVSIFNAENGAKVKSLPRHKADVIHILECKEIKMFVTSSIDN